MRKLTYANALNEAVTQLMDSDERVVIMGQGVNSPWYVGRTTVGLMKRFGKKRVIDTPVCEDTITGAALGAAMAGLRPIVVHPRMEFGLLATDQIINQAANWNYMSAGRVNVPVTIRPIVNRGGEQAAQHSHSLQAIYAHIPGLKVVMPATAYDAKGLLVASVQDPNPVVFIDDRWVYEEIDHVPEQLYSVPIGKGIIRRSGKDITIAASGFMAREAVRAAAVLEGKGIDAEIIDLRTVKPIDERLVIDSVKKTGRLAVADTGWKACGVSAEVAAIVAESDAFDRLKSPICRITLPPAPAPMSKTLEKAYYHNAETIVNKVVQLLSKGRVKK